EPRNRTAPEHAAALHDDHEVVAVGDDVVADDLAVEAQHADDGHAAIVSESGSMMLNVYPSQDSAPTERSPPICCTSARLMYSPSPEPPTPLVMLGSSR